MSGTTKIRVGAVGYLNARPLIYQLDKLAPEIELVLDLPSRIAQQLAQGRLDVALIPSVESFQDPEYQIVSDACIGCRGPVLSVKLFSRVPLNEIRTLALDEGSRTSAALSQILLREQFGIHPRLESLPIGLTVADSSADAVLLIGDRAIHRPAGTFYETWDLGEQWMQYTGHPFVFAMWTARRGFEVEPWHEVFARSRDLGVKHLQEIAVRESPSLGLTVAECVNYLQNHLYYYLGPEERAGLQLFRQKALQYGFLTANNT